ncbi:aminopeptidase P family protein [Natronorubrum daqingense]|uniref:Peptidase n=1 Tax=Natronorubrum daqingense TaxID=588898 RepID=A0A1N7FLD8_9EURY|nr:aminopeptidase P family protein [Natronorubrum daqingense]APX98367.1 peptidase [Natronorubrum daqingense]SIS01113.1 Xaa-Pro aminopeptidase [Natronorubrum daqingense]
MASTFERRLTNCRHRLERSGGDLLVCVPSPNLTYLTGFEESPSERHLLLFVPRIGTPTLVAPKMYEQQLATIPIDEPPLEVRTWDDDENPLEEIRAVLEGYETRHGLEFAIPNGVGDTNSDGEAIDDDRTPGDGSILVDDRMWATISQDLRACAPDATFGLASDVLESQRIRKDDVELEALRRAGAIADRVSLEIRSRGEELIGTTESALASDIEERLEAEGAGKPAFSTIVAAGANGARPHHHSSDHEIERGEPIVLDFGAFVDAKLDGGTGRYPGDQTRTIVPGEPTEEYKRVHEIVQKAQQAAVEAVEPGVTASAVDEAARSVIEHAGYGDAFTHRTGHGVGLEVHEPPYIVGGNDRELEPGMVHSIEPGIYLDGKFGVRIEDLVVVTETGSERLNDSPRGWETGDGPSE